MISRAVVVFAAFACVIVPTLGCKAGSSEVRRVELIRRPESLVRRDYINGILVRQPASAEGRELIEVLLCYGGLASEIESMPVQRRWVAGEEPRVRDAFDVKVSAAVLGLNRPARVAELLADPPPLSFKVDPNARTVAPTDLRSWINLPPDGLPKQAPTTLAFFQTEAAFQSGPLKFPFPPARSETIILDRSRRFYARACGASSLADARDPTPNFRRGPYGMWVFIYDRGSGKELGLPVELSSVGQGFGGIHMAFTHDSKWVVVVADSPSSVLWVIPTGLPRPEEPWTPK